MRIQLGSERQVKCGCGKWAYEHEVMVRSASHGRRVGIHSHAESLHHQEHRERLDDIAEFFEKLDAAAVRLAAEIGEGGKLELGKGQIVEIDLCYVMPDACSRYQEAAPEFTVRAFGLVEEFRMTAVTIGGLDIEALIASVKKNAEALAASLEARHERLLENGKF